MGKLVVVESVGMPLEMEELARVMEMVVVRLHIMTKSMVQASMVLASRMVAATKPAKKSLAKEVALEVEGRLYHQLLPSLAVWKTRALEVQKVARK